MFLRQASGFRLGLALYNDPVERGRLIRELSRILAGEGVQMLVLDLYGPEPSGGMLDRLEALFREADPARRAVAMVINLESRVDYAPELARGDQAPDSLLSTANLQRDRFPEVCPGPVVLWMTELLERAFFDQAPDLWHWRSHVFDLRTRSAPEMAPHDPDGRPWRSGDHRLHPEHRIRRLEEELAAYRKGGSAREEIQALNSLGIARLDIGDARRALRDFEEVLKLARKLGNRDWEGTALGNLGLAHADLGDARSAIGYYEQHLEIVREIGDRRGEGNALGNLGNAHLQLGDARRAIGYYEQQLVIVREIGDRRGEGNALWNAALAHESLGERAEALARAEAALAIFEAIEDPNAGMVRARVETWRGS